MFSKAELTIRKYQPGDRQELRKICSDTAYFGEPCEAFFPDREFLADIIMNYYTDYESEHTWVAQYRKNVIGYICAGIDDLRYSYIMALRILPISFLKALARADIFDSRTARLIRYNFRSLLRSESSLKKVDCRKFSAHIHQNIAGGFRGLGIGSELFEAMINDISQKAPGIRFKALRSQRRFPFFERYGFTLIDCRRVKIWEEWLKKSPLYFMEYIKAF